MLNRLTISKMTKQINVDSYISGETQKKEIKEIRDRNNKNKKYNLNLN